MLRSSVGVLTAAFVVMGCSPSAESLPVESSPSSSGGAQPTDTSDAGTSPFEPAGAATTRGRCALGASRIAAGYQHSIAVQNDGTVLAWGDNESRQAGQSASTKYLTSPTAVAGLTGVSAVAAGYGHSLALVRSDHTVRTWGAYTYGQTGDGQVWADPPPMLSEVHVLGGDVLWDVVAIAAGSNHSLALLADKTVWAWGRNANGQLGDGTSTNRPGAVQARQTNQNTGGTELTDVVAIAAGNAHSLALKNDGTVWAWGSDQFDELGDYQGSGTDAHPMAIEVMAGTQEPLTGVIAIAAAMSHNVALKADGTVWTWGSNLEGALGNGVTEAGGQGKHTMAVQVLDATRKPLAHVVAVAAADERCLALTDNHELLWWGTDHSKVQTTNVATTIPTTTVAGVALAGGLGHTIELTEDGTIWAWGTNDHGQLGTGSVDASSRIALVESTCPERPPVSAPPEPPIP